MTNDQTRMTNEFPMTKSQWSLVIGHSLVIRIWSLVTRFSTALPPHHSKSWFLPIPSVRCGLSLLRSVTGTSIKRYFLMMVHPGPEADHQAFLPGLSGANRKRCVVNRLIAIIGDHLLHDHILPIPQGQGLQSHIAQA